MRDRMRDSMPSARGGGSRRTLLAAAALAVLVLGSLPWLVHPWFDAIGDGAIYLSTTRSLLAGDGYAYLEQPFRIRPPGFPVLIAPVVAAMGLHFRALNLATSLFGAVAVLLLFAHQRTRLGAPLAALVSLAVWLNPGFQKLANQVLSDVPGLALLLACLLVERWADRRPSWHREVVLGVLVGLATYVRTLFLLLVPAIVIARWLHRRSDGNGALDRRFFAIRVLPLAVAVFVVVLPWSLRNAAVAPTPPMDDSLIYDYWTAQWHQDPTDPRTPFITPGQLAERSEQRTFQVIDVLGSRLWPSHWENEGGAELFGWGRLLVTLLLLAGLVRAAVKHRESGELFALASLAVVLVYFGFFARLLLPVYVLALPASVETLRDGLRRLGVGATAALAATAAAVALLVAVDWPPRREWDRIQDDHARYLRNCSALQHIVPDGARLASSFGWYYDLCLGRPVFHFIPRLRRTPILEETDWIIARHRVDTVVLSSRLRHDVDLARYMTQRYGPPRSAGDWWVWRVR